MKLHFFQHVPFEGLGNIEVWAKKQGASISSTRFYEKDFSAPAGYDFLVVMGGPMNVDEENIYPWLKQEKKWIAQAIDAGKKVLGVCLGAQLIARALGAPVYKNPQKEIGWWPVEWSADAKNHPAFSRFSKSSEVFHWHGDTFDLPKGCVRAASSKACLNQAFFYGNNVAGLQFHLETTPETARLLAENCGGELVAAPFIQDRETVLGKPAQFQALSGMLEKFLDGLWLKEKISA